MISTRGMAAALIAVATVAAGAGAQVDKGSIPASSKRMVPALDGKLNVPEGFKVQVFADTVRGARFMALGPDGAVYVSLPRGGATGGRGAPEGTPRSFASRSAIGRGALRYPSAKAKRCSTSSPAPEATICAPSLLKARP